MKKIFFGFLLIFSQIFSSCFIDLDLADCERGSGRSRSEYRSVRNFERISLSGSFEVRLRQGNSTEVEVVADDNLLERIETYVSGQTLYIEARRCINERSKTIIYVETPQIRRIDLSGSGRIISENTIETDNLELYVSGSGEMDMGVEADYLKTQITGLGTAYLEGLCKEQDITITGSGLYDAFRLDSRTCHSTISGSGRANVWVYSDLQVTISGSGELHYRGNPRIRLNLSGSGRVVDAN